MILDYLLRLALLLPLVGGLAWSSLWLWKRLQVRMPNRQPPDRLVRITEILPVGSGARLAVIDFGGQQILVAIASNGITTLASDSRGDFDAA